MAKPDEVIKIVQGEVVEETKALTITGRKKSEPEIQRLPSKERKLTPEQKETAKTLMQHIDTKDIERRLLNTYAGGFVGFSFEGDDEDING